MLFLRSIWRGLAEIPCSPNGLDAPSFIYSLNHCNKNGGQGNLCTGVDFSGCYPSWNIHNALRRDIFYLLQCNSCYPARATSSKKVSASRGSEFSHNKTVLSCFLQVESSNPLFDCSKLDLHSLSMILCSMGWTMPRRGRWEGSPSQQASISCQHSSSNAGRRSGRTPLLTLFQRWSLLAHLSKASGNFTCPEQMYQNRIPNA